MAAGRPKYFHLCASVQIASLFTPIHDPIRKRRVRRLSSNTPALSS